MSVWPGSPVLFFIYVLMVFPSPQPSAFLELSDGPHSHHLAFSCLFSKSPSPLSAQQLYGMSCDGRERSGHILQRCGSKVLRSHWKYVLWGRTDNYLQWRNWVRAGESSGHPLPVGTGDASERRWQVRSTLVRGSEGERWETEPTWYFCTSVYLLCLPGYFF